METLVETLYNGVTLPREWPPRNIPENSTAPLPVPYLENPPAVIPIDVGRQLFVDDFLIERTTLTREYWLAQKFEGNPILSPETPLERDMALPVACPKSGGVWWDPVDGRFKMWYEAGWLHTMAYAVSDDGLRWQRPQLDVQPPTNRLVPSLRPDSTTIFIDHDAKDPSQRYKMFLRSPGGKPAPAQCLTSSDGIHWSNPVNTPPIGDRSTMFYNPFRKKWVYSIRSTVPNRGRTRHYREHSDFIEGATWQEHETVFWTGADDLDLPDEKIGDTPQLYNLDAVAYESIMLGMFQIHRGPKNEVCQQGGFPKITELSLAYSRDGFHWHRPDRRAFIPATRDPSAWDRGYVQSVGGVCLIVDEALRFYYIGFQGSKDVPNEGSLQNGMYAHGSTGMAMLRRDGFASMGAGDEGGELTTRPVVFRGRFLFVNLDASRGELRAEVLDLNGNPIEPFTLAHCLPVHGDSTKTVVTWRHGRDLSSLAGTPVRFRFHVRSGKLYSFWVSASDSGASGGYVAAGGPKYAGGKDV